MISKSRNIVKIKKYQNREIFLPINISSVCSIYFWAWTTIAGIEQTKTLTGYTDLAS